MKKIMITTTLEELIKAGPCKNGTTLEEILEKIGLDKVQVIEIAENEPAPPD